MRDFDGNLSSLDELYGFADEDFVYKLQKKYAKYFKAGPVIDLGSGRGIFLQILKEGQIEAFGVDNSEAASLYAKEKGLKVYREDIFAFLKKNVQEGKKYEGIFCSHLIEHFPPEKVEELLSLCFKILNFNGILILITPNSQDLRVITDIFWLDKTHVRPYPQALLKVLLTKSGFKINELGVDEDTKLKHFRTGLFDKISKLFFSKTPMGNYLNTGHDIFIIGEKLPE